MKARRPEWRHSRAGPEYDESGSGRGAGADVFGPEEDIARHRKVFGDLKDDICRDLQGRGRRSDGDVALVHHAAGAGDLVVCPALDRLFLKDFAGALRLDIGEQVVGRQFGGIAFDAGFEWLFVQVDIGGNSQLPFPEPAIDRDRTGRGGRGEREQDGEAEDGAKR
jgi:hypothetical protein